MLYNSQGIIKDIQLEFLKRLEIRDIAPRLIVPSLLLQLLQTDDEIIDLSLGHFGQKLKHFVQEIDHLHPEIHTLFNGALSDEQDFSQNCRELLSLASFAKANKLNRVMPFLGQLITNKSPQIIQEINYPLRSHVRLLKNPEEREEIRLLKKSQTIDLSILYRKGETFWQAQPPTFNNFLRFESAYREEIEKAEKKAKRYEELGCTSLVEEIVKTVDQFKQQMDQPYYGFNRINMLNAAIILAKSLDYTYKTQYFTSFQDEISDKVVVSKDIFGEQNFLINRLHDYFVYEPRIYPLHDLQEIAPLEVMKTIEMFEQFPETGGKPLFDYFGVIVPSIAFPNEEPSFINPEGLVYSYSTMEEATKEFDKMLIRSGILSPIIVAERDKKCYFVCYFK